MRFHDVPVNQSVPTEANRGLTSYTKGQCILSGILPLPSCYLNAIAAAKKNPLQAGKGTNLAKLQKGAGVHCYSVRGIVSQLVMSGYVSALARTKVLFPAGIARRCRVRFRPPRVRGMQASFCSGVSRLCFFPVSG
jgi:hypothetical protein